MLSKCGTVNVGNSTRLMCQLKKHLKKSFPFKRPLRQDPLLDRMKSGALFGYVLYDIKLLEHSEDFAIFSPIFRNTNVCRQNIGAKMQEYAEKEKLRYQPRRMLYSSF